MAEDWSAVAKAIDGRLNDLGWRQHELAERAQVSQAIVRELQHNTAQRRRNTRTLEAISVALGWHAGHLNAVLKGRNPAEHVQPEPIPTDAVAARLASIDHRLRTIERRLDELGARLPDDDAQGRG